LLRATTPLALGAAWLIAAAQGVSAADPPSVACAAPVHLPLPPPGKTVSLSTVSDGLLSLVEHGQDISVKADDVIEIATPPRLGSFSLAAEARAPILISRARPGDARGYVEARLDCHSDASAQRMRAWERRVQSFERQIAEPLPEKAFDDLQPQVDALRSDAPQGYARVLAEHLEAQALLMTGRSAAAASAFAKARKEWLAIGDRERAAAAAVAEAEDRLRSGAYATVLSLARSLPGAPDRSEYWNVRLEDARCLTFEYLGKLQEAAHCFVWTTRALADLGETLELISTQQNYARVERELGNHERAATLAASALAAISQPQWDRVPGPDIPVVRGRVERLLEELALGKGDISGAVRHAQHALKYFDQAHHLRWQANTLLRIAEMYNEIGAYADASDAVDAALQRLSPVDAPARIAAAELTKSDIELARGNARQAIALATKARLAFESLGMRDSAAGARVTVAEATLADGQRDAARAIVDSMPPMPPALANRASLIRAEIDVSGAASAPANAHRDALDRPVARPLPQWLAVQSILARRMLAAGHADAALRLMENTALHLTGLASRAANPVLRLSLERRRGQLLTAVVPMILSLPSMQERVTAAWHWMLLTDAAPSLAVAAPAAPRAAKFDRALAEFLMPHAPGKTATPDDRLQQQLLDLVAATSAAPVRDDSRRFDVNVRDFQAALPQGTAVLAIFSAGASHALLYLSPDRSAVFALPGEAGALREQATDLTESTARDAPLAAIDGKASELSHLLFGSLDGIAIPQHLLIVAPAPFNGLPWALLTWPRALAPLVATTSVTLVAPVATPVRRSAGPVTLHAFAAGAGPETSASGLPGLAAPAGELVDVERERRKAGWRIGGNDPPTRAAVLSALADSGSWVHVAGHGSSMTEYLGRSGVWLSAQQQAGDPELLSWMDVVEQGVRADVVVLNACALGESPTTSLSASTGFADATLRAGADQVVAALWPIDDTAAALWASTFYARLPARPSRDQVADALRAAMLRLRETRVFRHPRYWASLVQLARMHVPDPGTRIAGASAGK
jgi:tetratricopeptide (TPR) repeat protein